ncbi:MAG TPA: BON domain-containing protein [Candidatus Aquabacterium excrementipullorum]|nr:BON domain-containing protein [Candidatus Aquabacterium excrementipullorum]
MNTFKQRLIVPATLALLGTVALSGCNRHDERTAGQQLDSAIASASSAADNAATEARKDAAELKADTQVALNDAKNASADASASASAKADALGQKIKSGVSDATITTKVNAALAADDKLKATKINVDTKDGQVTLTGVAPDVQSLGRASELAQAVSGVTNVVNRLTVDKTS